MAYSRKFCRVCGRPAIEAGNISSRGKCATCAMRNTIRAAEAAIQCSLEMHGQAIDAQVAEMARMLDQLDS